VKYEPVPVRRSDFAVPLPAWAELVRVTAGQFAGLYALRDTRRGKPPFVPVPPGLSLVKPTAEDVVVDLGAYVGAFSFYCAARGARVTAYEPSPWPAACLRRTIADGARIVLKEAAVVGAPAPTTILVNLAQGGLGLSNSVVRVPRGVPKRVRVPAVLYDAAVAGATVLKVDVEGAEYSYRPLVRDGLRAVILSFHAVPGVDWITIGQAMVADLEAAGFRTAKPIKAWQHGSYNAEGVWLR